MDLSAIRKQNDLHQLSTCTHEQFPKLKQLATEQHNNVLEAKGHINAFERRKLQESLRDVMRELEAADMRIYRREFRFQGDPIPDSDTPFSATKNNSTDCNPANPNSAASNNNQKTASSGIQISDKGDTSVHLDETCRAKHVHMQNLSATTVVGEGPASISISGGKDLCVNVGSDGPLMVQNVLHLVFIVTCHQLRMHGCTDCLVFARVPSNRIIIEGCRGLLFGAGTGVGGMHLSEGAFAVDDFDWPSDTPNPHFSQVTSERLALLASKNVADYRDRDSLSHLRKTMAER